LKTEYMADIGKSVGLESGAICSMLSL